MPLVSVNVNASQKDTRNSATDQPAPKVPRRGPFAGGRSRRPAYGPETPPQVRASGGAIEDSTGPLQGVYRHSAQSVSGCLQIGGAV